MVAVWLLGCWWVGVWWWLVGEGGVVCLVDGVWVAVLLLGEWFDISGWLVGGLLVGSWFVCVVCCLLVCVWLVGGTGLWLVGCCLVACVWLVGCFL